jgi:hypothetical protein
MIMTRTRANRGPRSWLVAMALLIALPGAGHALPTLVFSISASGQTICDSDCTTCTVGSGECILVNDEDLITCRPLGTTLPIDSCDWELLFDGDALDINLTSQMFAVEIVPNGNVVFRSGGDKTLPDLSQIKARDIGLFLPPDVELPYTGGGPYTAGTFKLFLDGDATQATTGAKPWNAVEVLANGTCEKTITASGQHTCDLIGSLAGGGTIGGLNFRDEDLLRCHPIANSGGGAVTACDYAMFWEGDQVNGGAGFTGNFQALEILDFDGATMTGSMVFRGPNDPDIPAHDAARDLVRYTGTFGNGLCMGGALCANDLDCPGVETCDTGTCTLSPDPCASDGDCSGSGNVCNRTRTSAGTFDLYFLGNPAGLSGQSVQAFSIVPDVDGDGSLDGIDNCPDDVNPPSICTDGSTPCGNSTDCTPGHLCVQPDADGDGVGDVCDQCDDRDDAVCFCGDGIPDFPSEQCDLGANNGLPNQPCSATCTIIGHCTDDDSICQSAAQCTAGEGCCGDGLVDGPEQCDDGNGNPNDDCDNQCALTPQGIPTLGCEDVFAPLLTPDFVKRAIFKDAGGAAGFEKWKAKGDFNLATSDDLDASAEAVRLVLNQGTGPALFDGTLPPGTFVLSGAGTTRKWKFADKEGDVPTAVGWQKAKLILKLNKLKHVVKGQGPALAIDTADPIRIRHTLRIGDTCATGVVSCIPNGSGTSLKCSTIVFGSASGAFVD